MKNSQRKIKPKVDLINNPTYYFNMAQAEKFLDLAEKCITRVQDSTNPREMILETWLLIDYRVRDLLLGAFNLEMYNYEDFDLRYEILPQSFRSCLKVLKEILRVHRNRRPPVNAVQTVVFNEFMEFFSRYDYEAFERLVKAEEAYILKCHPNGTGHVPPIQTKSYVNEEWLKVVERIPQSWFQSAKMLNNARNLAAHSYDDNKIVYRFGLTGSNAIEQARQKCLDLIRELVGVIPNIAERDNDSAVMDIVNKAPEESK